MSKELGDHLQFVSDIWVLANVHEMDSDDLGVIAERLIEKLSREYTREYLDELAYGKRQVD